MESQYLQPTSIPQLPQAFSLEMECLKSLICSSVTPKQCYHMISTGSKPSQSLKPNAKWRPSNKLSRASRGVGHRNKSWRLSRTSQRNKKLKLMWSHRIVVASIWIRIQVDLNVSFASVRESQQTSFNVWMPHSTWTPTGQRKHSRESPRRPAWARGKCISGAGTRSGRSLVLRRQSVCDKSNTKWTRLTLLDANNCNWMVDK